MERIKKPVILTGNDVHSVLLTVSEQKEIEMKYFKEQLEYTENVIAPRLEKLLMQKDDVMDELAREVGFAQFDENKEGTGLRNYTALGKRKTEKIKEQLSLYDKLYFEHAGLKEINKQINETNQLSQEKINEIRQRNLREILEITNERIGKKDVTGKAIMSSSEYLEKVKNISVEEKEELNSTITAPINIKQLDGTYKKVEVDYNLAPFLQRIIDAGYSTGQSDSGTLSDHPNYRFVEGELIGEPVYYNKRGCSAYLTFWKPESKNIEQFTKVKVNQSEQIEDIKMIAEQCGWIIEEMDIFFHPSIRLSLPYAYDGSSSKEIIQETNKRVNEKFPELQKTDFLAWIDERDKKRPEIASLHGGVVRWTDEMIIKKWEELTQGLERMQKLREEQKENEGLKHISNVKTYDASNGNLYIRCSINGVSQLSKKLNVEDVNKINRGEDIRKIALNYYKEELNEVQQEHAHSIKR